MKEAFAACCALSVLANAQVSYFNKAFDYGLAELLQSTVETDSGFVFFGYGITPSGYSEIVMASVDTEGNEVWHRKYIDTLYTLEVLHCVPLDDGYVMVGPARDRLRGQFDNTVLRTDRSGNVIWWRFVGDTLRDDRMLNAIVDENGDLVITGFMSDSLNPWGFSDYQAALTKLDETGNLIWERSYGVNSKYEVGRQLVQTPDSGYLVCGYSSGPFQGDDRDLMLIKTDRDGNHQWTKYYGIAHSGWGGAICKSLEGGYMVAGYREVFVGTQQEYHAWLLKIDEDGNMEWEKFYSFEGTNNGFWRKILQLPDSSYVAIGWVYGKGSIVKVDRFGEIIWQRGYTQGHVPVSFETAHYFYGMDTTSDGGFIVCGSTLISSQTTQDGWLLKLDEWGCDTPGCHIEDSTGTALPPGPPASGESITVWPNPNNGTFTLQLPSDGEWQVQLFDLNGGLIEERRQERTAQWNVSSVSKGMYLLRAMTKDGTSATVKVLVE